MLNRRGVAFRELRMNKSQTHLACWTSIHVVADMGSCKQDLIEPTHGLRGFEEVSLVILEEV